MVPVAAGLMTPPAAGNITAITTPGDGVKLTTFAALALLCGAANAADYTCTTEGNQTTCRENKPLTLYPVNKFDEMRKGWEEAGRRPENVRVIRGADGRACAYEMKGRVPVLIACE